MKKVIISQTICGIFFSLFGGQPLIIMLTTAPLALYIKSKYLYILNQQEVVVASRVAAMVALDATVMVMVVVVVVMIMVVFSTFHKLRQESLF